MFPCEISIIILICQKLGLVGLVQQNVKLSLPYGQFDHHSVHKQYINKTFENIEVVLVF